MAEITSKMVMELRKRTGVGMMDCKKALTEADGDLEAAADLLRTKGLAKAAKRAGREAREGAIRIVKTDQRHGAMLLINCETDFVSRSDEFQELTDQLAHFFAKADVPSQCLGATASEEHLEVIKGMALPEGDTVGETIVNKIAKLGENIHIGSVVIERSDDAGDYLQDYLHGNRVGVLVCLTTGKPETHTNPAFTEVARDLAMQVAAAMPRVALAVGRDAVDAAEVEHERKILMDQAQAEGKPAEIAEKMVLGRLNKFYGEVCLLEQPYIRDDKMKVKDVLGAAEKELGDTIKVARFHRFALGE